jgi:hypothetical protein
VTSRSAKDLEKLLQHFSIQVRSRSHCVC